MNPSKRTSRSDVARLVLIALAGVVALCSRVEAATWHVKPPATCSNTGNGTASGCAASPGGAGAWNDPVSAFHSGSVTCGDTVLFYTGSWVTANNGGDPSVDGGFTITVSSAGCAGNPITFKAAPGNAPELRNCPSGSTTFAACNRPTLNLVDKSHITVDGFKIVGALWNSTDLPSGYNATVDSLRKGITLINNEITVGWEEQGGGNWAGIWLSWTNGLIIRNNYIHNITPDNLTGADQQSSATCVKYYTNYNHVTEYNTCRNVHTSNPAGDSQAGGFDDKQDANGGIIRYNWCEDVPTCIRIQNQLMGDGGGTVTRLFTCASGAQAYGNVMIGPSGSNRPAMKVEAGPLCDWTAYNNTIINFAQCLMVQPEPPMPAGTGEVTEGIVWWNNICHGLTDRNLISFTTTLNDIDQEDYNAYTAAANYQTSAGFQTSLAAYVAAVSSRNAHSAEVDCSFVGSGNYHLQGGSSCKAGQVNTGRVGGVVGGATVDLGAYFDKTCVGYGCIAPTGLRTGP